MGLTSLAKAWGGPGERLRPSEPLPLVVESKEGTIQKVVNNRFFGPTATFVGKKVTIDCVVSPEENIEIKCEDFLGNGFLNAPFIKIVVGQFSFRGILQCFKDCTIITRMPVDQSKFSMKGPGKFNFIVNPSLENFNQGGEICFGQS